VRSPRYVFLDVNHWIYLSLGYHDRSHPKANKAVATALLEKVEKDELRFPVGTAHFIEHLQNNDPERRDRLAKVFELYSRGCCLTSWTDIWHFELEQALDHVFDGSEPARPRVFGRGFMSTLGAKAREILGEGHDEHFLAFFEALSTKPGALVNLLTTIDETDRIAQKTSTSRLSKENATTSEDLRMHRRNCSREMYRRAQHATYTYQLSQLIAEHLAMKQRSIEDFFALGRTRLSEFWSAIPSLDADCELTAYRDRQWSREIQPNDIKDVWHLAVAVPYCDAVVVENFWQRAIAETQLGTKYETQVFSDLAELIPYADSERKPKW
jgi:hypothetical protein